MHELGHMFGLSHSHQDFDVAEPPGDCATAGDRVCDLGPDCGPASVGNDYACPMPRRPQCALAGCALVAPPNTPFAADPALAHTLMSYYSSCRDSFTDDQLTLVRCFLNEELSHALEPACVPREPHASRACDAAGDVVWVDDCQAPGEVAEACEGRGCNDGVCVPAPPECDGESSQACGSCGTQSRTCTYEGWTEWSPCEGEGACQPGAVEPCEPYGARLCGLDCQWAEACDPCLGRLEGDVLEAGEVPDPTWADSCATRADVEVHNLVCLGGTPTLETASRVFFRETDGLPLSDWLRTECLPVGHPECGEAGTVTSQRTECREAQAVIVTTVEDCHRPTQGLTLSEGDWGECVAFDDDCRAGAQSRIDAQCNAGLPVAVEVGQACEPDSASEVNLGDWGACVFADECTTSGRQRRTRQFCDALTGAVADTFDEQVCPRASRDGLTLETGTWSNPVYDSACDTSAEIRRIRTVCRGDVPTPVEDVEVVRRPVGVPETCNGADDDCNGVVDDVLGVGEVCYAGTGDCQRAGRRVCVGAALGCDARPGPSGVEACDGRDNDCDGVTDDGIAPTPCSTGVGACRASGATNCVGGETVCGAVAGAPSVERCNSVDDDCNGVVDDGAGAGGGACSVGLGACRSDGVYFCSNGTLTCGAVPRAPGVEVCNAVDDDCDGTTDDGPLCPANFACTGGGACECNATDFWSPTTASRQVTSDGITLRVEYRASSVDDRIEMRVCTTNGGNIVNILHVHGEDMLRTIFGFLIDRDIDGRNATCTPWTRFGNLGAWDAGQSLGGPLAIVSPSHCADDWGSNSNCNSPPAVGCGTCWATDVPVFSRTCRE
jgi:hypothetical protein